MILYEYVQDISRNTRKLERRICKLSFIIFIDKDGDSKMLRNQKEKKGTTDNHKLYGQEKKTRNSTKRVQWMMKCVISL